MRCILVHIQDRKASAVFGWGERYNKMMTLRFGHRGGSALAERSGCVTCGAFSQHPQKPMQLGKREEVTTVNDDCL